MYLTDTDLLNNKYKYTVQEIEENVSHLDHKIMLATQTLTAEFCVKYILDLDIDHGGEESYIFDVCYIIEFQKHLSDEDMRQAMNEQGGDTVLSHTPPLIEEEEEKEKEKHDPYHGIKNDPIIVGLICENHENVKKEVPQSPCRFMCKLCKKKKVHGYTNPDHVSNPFGYLFLVPCVCIDCSLTNKRCMWCDPRDTT